MKWFKHLSDSHSNLKLEAVIDEFGMVGYGFFWLCDELIAQQGEGFCLKADKRWKNSLIKKSQLQVETIDKILTFFAEMKLIDGDALTQGDLHIPKLEEYGDEYSSRKKSVGTKSGEARDNVGLDKIRIEENRIEENTASADYLKKIPAADLKEFTERFEVGVSGIKSKAEELSNYCVMHGKRYKNYKAFLLNALKRDFKDRPPTKAVSPPQVEVPLTPEQIRIKNEALARIREQMTIKRK